MYKHRTEEGIRKLKEIVYAKIGNPKALARRRELHRINPKVRGVSSSKERAKRLNIPFGFKKSKELPKIPKYCPILKMEMFVNDKVSGDNSPTLDRINNNKGYIKGNVQWISRKANQMKSNANFEEIELLYLHMKFKGGK